MSIKSVLFGLLATGGIAYGVYRLVSALGSEATGELVVTGTANDFSTKLASCESGQRTGYFGVALFDEHDRGVARIVLDPVKGYTVLVRTPNDKAAAITPADCPGMTVEVRRTNTEVNEIRLLDGEARIDCEITGGGRLKLNVTFSDCG
jgi:hypothetical protein